MPIYAYRCTSCGHAQDMLRKISDPPLNVCPACGAATFVKQVTAAGFQLKGSGWYVTDFRDNKKPGKAAEADAAAPANGAAASDAAVPNGGAEKSDAAKAADAPAPATKKGEAAAAPVAAPAPAAASPPASDKGKA